MSELEVKTFDLGAVLAGQDYPEKIVDVYFNEALAYEVSKANSELNILSKIGGKEYEKAEKIFDEMLKKISKFRYVFHLKAIPSSVRKQIEVEVETKCPFKINALGMPEQNKKADELFASLMMEAHIVKIVDPEGAEIIKPSLEVINDLRVNAPLHVIKFLEEEIVEFSNSISKGFEVAAKSADFLSTP